MVAGVAGLNSPQSHVATAIYYFGNRAVANCVGPHLLPDGLGDVVHDPPDRGSRQPVSAILRVEGNEQWASVITA